jgi:hypothetical protein
MFEGFHLPWIGVAEHVARRFYIHIILYWNSRDGLLSEWLAILHEATNDLRVPEKDGPCETNRIKVQASSQDLGSFGSDCRIWRQDLAGGYQRTVSGAATSCLEYPETGGESIHACTLLS